MPLSPTIRRALALGLALPILSSSAVSFGHVRFIAPAPEEDAAAPQKLRIGATYKVSWEVLIEHDPTGFDLDLLTSRGGDAVTIAHGLPVPQLEYDWVVPDSPCSPCFLRVTQRNTINDDYESLAPIVIAADAPAPSDPPPSGGSAASGGGSDGAGGSGGAGGSASGGSKSGGASTGGSKSGGAPSGGSSSGGSSSGGSSSGGSSVAGQLSDDRAAAADGGGCGHSRRSPQNGWLFAAGFCALLLGRRGSARRRLSSCDRAAP